MPPRTTLRPAAACAPRAGGGRRIRAGRISAIRSLFAVALGLAGGDGCTLFVTNNNAREIDAGPAPEVLAVDLDRALANIADIVSVGDRAPGMNAALATKIAGMFEQAGVQEVAIEDFAIPVFVAGPSTAGVVEPAELARPLLHVVNQFTGSGDVQAALFDLKNAREAKPEAAGKIVLIDALQTSSVRVQYDNAIASGAAGVILNSNVDGGFLRQRHVWRFERKGALIGPLPTISIGKEDALALRASLDAGAPVIVHIKTENTTATNMGHTVIARIPGTAHPEHDIVVNAHMDSWFQGVVDDVQAIAALLELAHVYTKYPPAYGLELVVFDIEETGLLGSASYLRNRSPGARDRIVSAITLEMLAPQNAEVTLVATDPLPRDAAGAPWEAALEQSGMTSFFTTPLSATDLMVAFNGEVPADQKNFWERGIPGYFVVSTYGPFHTEADSLDLTDEPRLDGVMRAIVESIRLVQDIPPDVLSLPPSSWIQIELATPLAPVAGAPLFGDLELLSTRSGEATDAAVVATLYDEAGTLLIDESTITRTAPGAYNFAFAVPMSPGARYVVSTSAVSGQSSGRNWFRVAVGGAPLPDAGTVDGGEDVDGGLVDDGGAVDAGDAGDAGGGIDAGTVDGG